MDSLGATTVTTDYAAVGNCAKGLYGAAAAEHDSDRPRSTGELVRAAVRAYASAVDRDTASGNGFVVHVLYAGTGRWEAFDVSHRND